MRRRSVIVVGVGVAGVAAAARRGRSGRGDGAAGPDRRSTPARPISPDDAAERTRELLALPRIRRRDEALTFAPTHATTVEALVHGHRYFPAMLADMAAATHSLHLLVYAFRPGATARAFLDVIEARARAGVDVRVAVDAIGSGVDLGARGFYRELRAAGAQVVANDGLAMVRHGHLGARRAGAHLEDALHFDHRKVAVIDGCVAWIGGTGIEDRFADGRFTDVMCRVTGPVVAQMQVAFLVSWVKDGGPRPPEVAPFFPAVGPAAGTSGTVPATLLMNVPGTGHHPIRDALEGAFDGARDRIDVANPYPSNAAIIARLGAAARRGVAVRVIVPAAPDPPHPMRAFRAWAPALRADGVEILEHPGMLHAKVYGADRRLFVGSCNLDDLSLYRNDELDLRLDGDDATAVGAGVFDELASASRPWRPTPGRGSRIIERATARASRLL